MKKTILNPSFGLFYGIRPTGWFKDVMIYLKRRRFMNKHGYSPVCQWEYFETILEISKQIFTFMRNERTGDIPFPGGNEETWSEMNDKFYDELLEDIHIMQEENTFGDQEAVEKAKEHFFSQVSKYFFHLWD